ncbi:hypothetical protein HHK36_017825 [Tetracentron sinense]|uniref:Bifunctional inhibitor/plant lipid transfer protein/seed storage helical domain-containing protein n=1 Tax=Tetracentron sinense TaxID=13715 RepID=A0A835DCY4_TETSI|nr:hypothetical protein HHK36_017825 [Tetracentron sinense]
MAVFNIRCLAFAILVIVGVVISSGSRVSAQSCQGNIAGLILQCQQYVQKSGPKTPPSPGCCGVVQTVDVPCVCKYVTKEVEDMISMEKVVYVTQYCGKTVPHGTKCGTSCEELVELESLEELELESRLVMIGAFEDPDVFWPSGTSNSLVDGLGTPDFLMSKMC